MKYHKLNKYCENCYKKTNNTFASLKCASKTELDFNMVGSVLGKRAF